MLGVTDDISRSPSSWCINVGRFVINRNDDVFQICYNADTVAIPLLTVANVKSINKDFTKINSDWAPPKLSFDTIGAVYFVTESNVVPSPINDSEIDENSPGISTSKDVDGRVWREYFKKGLEDVKDGNLRVGVNIKETDRVAIPTFTAEVFPYFSVRAGLMGGTNYTAPGVVFQVVDNFGANTSPSILTNKPSGTVVYDGVTGALGYGAVKTQNVIRLQGANDDSALVFITIIRAFSPPLKVNTPYYTTARVVMYFKEWVVVIGTWDYGLRTRK